MLKSEILEILKAGEVFSFWGGTILIIDKKIDIEDSFIENIAREYISSEGFQFLMLRENGKLNLGHASLSSGADNICKYGLYDCTEEDEEYSDNFFGAGFYCCNIRSQKGREALKRYTYVLFDEGDWEKPYLAIFEAEYNGEYLSCLLAQCEAESFATNYLVIKKPKKINITNIKRIYDERELETYFNAFEFENISSLKCIEPFKESLSEVEFSGIVKAEISKLLNKSIYNRKGWNLVEKIIASDNDRINYVKINGYIDYEDSRDVVIELEDSSQKTTKIFTFDECFKNNTISEKDLEFITSYCKNIDLL